MRTVDKLWVDKLMGGYGALRQDEKSILGYGLLRRTLQLQKLVAQAIKLCNLSRMRIVDFGCSDGAMLKSLAESHHGEVEAAVGFDKFPNGLPENERALRLRFEKVDLYRAYPYPLADNTHNVLIASSFFKHHPDPLRFLGECHRILEPGGVLILLEPCPWVVRIGIRLKYFRKESNRNIWSYRRLATLLRESGLRGEFTEVMRQKYWVAPNHFFYKAGLERVVPSFLVERIGLHQSIILAKQRGC